MRCGLGHGNREERAGSETHCGKRPLQVTGGGSAREKEQPQDIKTRLSVTSGHPHSYTSLKLPVACPPPILDCIVLKMWHKTLYVSHVS